METSILRGPEAVLILLGHRQLFEVRDFSWRMRVVLYHCLSLKACSNARCCQSKETKCLISAEADCAEMC